LILAELNGKKIGPHGVITSTIVIGGGFTVTVVEQLLPGHASSHRVASVETFTVIVAEPETPVVSSVTSVPVVEESVPALVDHE
jgi:hypothetical protein